LGLLLKKWSGRPVIREYYLNGKMIKHHTDDFGDQIILIILIILNKIKKKKSRVTNNACGYKGKI